MLICIFAASTAARETKVCVYIGKQFVSRSLAAICIAGAAQVSFCDRPPLSLALCAHAAHTYSRAH